MKKHTNTHNMSLIKRIIIGVSALIIIGAAFFGTSTWLSIQNEKAVEEIRDVKNIARSNDDDKKSREGRNETVVPKDVLASYSVAPDRPRALYIDKIGVRSRILPMGTNKDGSMQAPLGIYDAGWYTGSSVPSQDGALAVDGHASGPTKYGLFGDLGDLVNGDRVRIETGDGAMYQYEVVHKEDIGRGEVDMNKFLLPHGDSKKGLNLMTCAGDWEQNNQTFANRIVVYTKMVEA